MSRNTEDTMYEIHTALTESKLWDAFNIQIKKGHVINLQQPSIVIKSVSQTKNNNTKG